LIEVVRAASPSTAPLSAMTSPFALVVPPLLLHVGLFFLLLSFAATFFHLFPMAGVGFLHFLPLFLLLRSAALLHFFPLLTVLLHLLPLLLLLRSTAFFHFFPLLSAVLLHLLPLLLLLRSTAFLHFLPVILPWFHVPTGLRFLTV